MSDYRDVVKALGKKLKKDKERLDNITGDADLFYVMHVRLEEEIRKAAKDSGMSMGELAIIASNAAGNFLNGMIDLSEKYDE